MKFTKHSIIIDGQNYCYWQKNRLHKNTIVLLHGFPGNHRGLIDLSNYLTDCRFIIPDLPACGESDLLTDKHTLNNYADWLNKFFVQLELDQPTVIGHSFGSRLALCFNSLEPTKINGLVLITPVTKVDGLIAQLGSLEYQIAGFLPPPLQKLWLSNNLSKGVTNYILYKSATGQRRNQLITAASQEINRVSSQVSIEMFDDFKNYDLLTPINNLKTKVLLIAGEQDDIAPSITVKALADLLPTAEFQIMKKAGHMLPLESPQATAKIVQNWIDKQTQ